MNKELLSEIRIVLESTRLSFNVIGALLFGSMALEKPTPYSDYDLLIIGDGINPKRHRRGDEVILLKQCLPSLPFDILLFTPQEVVSNFKNHNPLFLDIAEDGIIILDKNNFIETLIRETRVYTRTNGINRVGGAWKFPVKQGVATYL